MTKGTILVIDDDPGIVGLLEAVLEDIDYTVVSALNGRAIQIAHDIQPNVILLDIMMPGMDGREMSKRLRADPDTQHIPIIVMSALQHLESTAADMAVDDRLTKPFELADVYAIVEHWAQTASRK